MNYVDFRRQIEVSEEDLCREVFAERRSAIRVKKEKTVVRNLEKIFEATLRISNEKGFQAMSMRDLSRETGLSMGALYSYFSGKEGLLEMLQSRGRAITKRILEDRIRVESDPLEQLRAAIRTHLYLSEGMQPWFYFSYMEAKNLSKAERDKAIASELYTENIFADILRRGHAQGIFSVGNHQLLAGAIKALLQDWYLKRGKHAGRNVSVDQYADFVLNFVESFCVNKSDRSRSCEGAQ